MQTPIIWGGPETSYIRRYMDGIDKVVTDGVQNGLLYLKRILPLFLLVSLMDSQPFNVSLNTR